MTPRTKLFGHDNRENQQTNKYSCQSQQIALQINHAHETFHMSAIR